TKGDADETGVGGSVDPGTVGSAGGSTGAGGSAGSTTGAPRVPHNGSFSYLCGGAHATCSPDPGADDCTQRGTPGLGPGADASMFACQLVAKGANVVAACTTAGTAAAGDVCDPSIGADCLPGLACIPSGIGGGVCRTYCCADLESCPKKTTYCW